MITFGAIAFAFALVGGSLGVAPADGSASYAMSAENDAVIEAAIEGIDDPVQRESVRAWMEEAAGDGLILSAQSAEYSATSSGATAARAYPSGCGLHVLAVQNSNSVTNSTLTSCLTPYSFLTHQMNITGIDGFSGNQVDLTGYVVYNYAGSSSQSQNLLWRCKNGNASNFQARTKGIMAKGGVEYTTPWVYDTFSTKISCGW